MRINKMSPVKLIKSLDRFLGWPICLVLSLLRILEGKNGTEKKKILLIQLWGLGETALCLPAIKALRDSNKKATVDILTTERVKDVFYDNSDINEIKVLGLNPISILNFTLYNLRKYDVVIDMEEYLNISAIMAFFAGRERIGYSHGMRSRLYTKKVDYNDNQHVSQTFMDLLKPLGIVKKVSDLQRLNFSVVDKKNIDDLLKKNKIGKKDFIVGLGIGAAESVKERIWPKERFATLADYLIKKYNAKIIFVGNNEEKNLIDDAINLIKNKKNSYNFAGETNIRELFYLVSLCKLFIGNDAGPMHVAAAQRVRTIGLFGCNLPVRFAPFGKNSIAIRKQTGKACINVHKGEVDKCRYGMGNACVKEIEVEHVTFSVEKILKKVKTNTP